MPRPWEDSRSPGYHVSPWSSPSPSLDGSTAPPSPPRRNTCTKQQEGPTTIAVIGLRCEAPLHGQTYLLQNNPSLHSLALPQRATKSAIPASGSSRTGTRSISGWFGQAPSTTLFACKTPRRLVQAGELRPTASLIPKEPRWQVREDSLPSSLRSQAFPPKSQGENSSPPEAYHNSGPLPSPPGPVALSEACPFPAEETHPGHSDQYPRGHRD